MDDLERAIMQAHETGNQALLKRLQSQYRSSRAITRPGSSLTVTERGRASRSSEPDPTQIPSVIAIPPEGFDTLVTKVWDYAGEQEAGGFLLGRSTRDVILVDHVIDAGPFATATISDFNNDLDWGARMAEQYSTPVAGTWHSHPSGVASPSETDKRSWGETRRWFGLRAFASLIVPIFEGLWPDPPAGFVTFMRHGQSHTKRVEVIKEER
jgi:integrative and conjugative element protein (TIGR02256 family)